ncbi:MAG TPA: hypothetical protein VMR95_01235 [Candidatus Binatia bacterium]|nr:hypothetical protein [Candidatus Binatia bacterium]
MSASTAEKPTLVAIAEVLDDSELQSEAVTRAWRRKLYLMPELSSDSAQSEALKLAPKITTAEDEVILSSLTRSLRTLGIINNQSLVIGEKSKNVRPSIPGERFTGLLVSCEVDDPSFRWGKFVTDVKVNRDRELHTQETIGEATLWPLGAEAQALPCEIADEEVGGDNCRS